MSAQSIAAERAATTASATRLAKVVVEALDDAKAKDVTVLKVGDVTDMTDFFVVATGTSDTHVRSTADRIVEAARKYGTRAMHVEGTETGKWVVIDFVDIVVHLFVPTLREFYQLERLWSDAPIVPAARFA
jgi:ribosome-associated protein